MCTSSKVSVRSHKLSFTLRSTLLLFIINRILLTNSNCSLSQFLPTSDYKAYIINKAQNKSKPHTSVIDARATTTIILDSFTFYRP